MRHFRKPEGFVGGLIAGMMNWGHGAMTREVVGRLGVGPDDAVLDIGCGGGGAIALMAESGARVTGVDYSDASVRKSRARNREAVRNGRVAVERADALSLPFPAETFSLATAFETVFFWNDIQDCFKGVFRALRPGGRFAVAVEAWKREDGTIACPEVFVRNLAMNVYSEAELRALFEGAGFSAVTTLKGERGNWICVVGAKTFY